MTNQAATHAATAASPMLYGWPAWLARSRAGQSGPLTGGHGQFLLLLLLSCTCVCSADACKEACEPLVAGGVFNTYSKSSTEWSSSEITQVATTKLVSLRALRRFHWCQPPRRLAAVLSACQICSGRTDQSLPPRTMATRAVLRIFRGSQHYTIIKRQLELWRGLQGAGRSRRGRCWWPGRRSGGGSHRCLGQGGGVQARLGVNGDGGQKHARYLQVRVREPSPVLRPCLPSVAAGLPPPQRRP